MTELLSDIETPSDAELISRVRGGDVAAYGELFSRHVEAANRLGRQLARGPDVDDLVSEAFAKVLQVIQDGGGPDVAFRAYLLTAVRRLHVDRVRAASKLHTSDDMTQFDPGIPFQDTAVADFENGAAAKAFASLPERWQLVLWHLEVEGQKPADIAPLLGMSANSVSALAYRAREGLRQAFLTMHLADISAEDCRWVNEHLGAYVRKGLARRDATKVETHLDECRRCMAMYLELNEVNSNLRGIIAPLLLGAAAASYCASTGTAAGITGVSALFGRARDLVTANASASTAGAVAAGVAAVATAGVMVLGPDTGRVISADQPFSDTTSLPNSAPPPALVPPGEVQERTAPERDEPADADVLDEQADVAGDPVVELPTSDSDGSGSDGPDDSGSEGSGGPGLDGSGPPGADGPGSDGAGTDAPEDGPGSDGPGEDEPNEEPPNANPGPGPVKNPDSDPPPQEDPDGEQTPPNGGQDGSPDNDDTAGDGDEEGTDGTTGDEEDTDGNGDGADGDEQTPGGDGSPPDDDGEGDEGDTGPVDLSVDTSASVTFEQHGANVTVEISVRGLPAGTQSVDLTVTANETSLVSVDGCAVSGDTVTCPVSGVTDRTFAVALRLPPGKSGEGDIVSIAVKAYDTLLRPAPDTALVGSGTDDVLVDTSPPKKDDSAGVEDPSSNEGEIPRKPPVEPLNPSSDGEGSSDEKSGGTTPQSVIDAMTGLL